MYGMNGKFFMGTVYKMNLWVYFVTPLKKWYCFSERIYLLVENYNKKTYNKM